MTAKQTADKLYLKYIAALNIRNDMHSGANQFAKDCALICVNEIIEAGAGDVIVGEGEDADLVSGFTFYSAVKSELEKS